MRLTMSSPIQATSLTSESAWSRLMTWLKQGWREQVKTGKMVWCESAWRFLATRWSCFGSENGAERKTIVGWSLGRGSLGGDIPAWYLYSRFQGSPVRWTGALQNFAPQYVLLVKSVPSVPSEEHQSTPQTPRVTRSRTRAREQAQSVKHSRLTAAERCSSEESLLSEVVSTIVPQLPTSLLVCKADSSLDLDEDETSVLVEESLARSEDSCTDDGVSGGGGNEADVSGSGLDSGQESRTGDLGTRPHVAPSVWPQLVSSTECSKPRRPVRHRSRPAWMRSGEWPISWPWASHLSIN